MMKNENPVIKRILGVTPGMGGAGSTTKWVYNVVKQVGNYGEPSAQRQRRLAAQDRPWPERAVDQGWPAVRAADSLICPTRD